MREGDETGMEERGSSVFFCAVLAIPAQAGNVQASVTPTLPPPSSAALTKTEQEAKKTVPASHPGSEGHRLAAREE